MYVEVIFLRNPLTYEAGGVCICACEVLDGVVCMFCTYTVSTPYGRRTVYLSPVGSTLLCIFKQRMSPQKTSKFFLIVALKKDGFVQDQG